MHQLIAIILFLAILCVLSKDNKKAPYISEEEDYSDKQYWYDDDDI